MFSKRNLALAVGVAACASFVGSMGAGVKFRTFTPAGTNAAENPDVDGICMVKYDANAWSPLLGTRGITTVHLHVTGLVANTTYGVKVDSDGSGISAPVAFTTNEKGDGDFHSEFPQDGTIGPVTCQIYIWDGYMGELINPSEPDPCFQIPNPSPNCDTRARYSDIFDITSQELRVTLSL